MKLALLLLPSVLVAQSLIDWSVSPVLRVAGYDAEFRREGCHSTPLCAVMTAPAKPPAGTFGNLSQTFDATPYRGHVVRLQAWVRVESKAPADHAQMWMEVNLPDRKKGFSDNMGDRPITSGEWTSYEITGEVAVDAVSVSIGVMGFGKGTVWVDGVTFEPVADEATATREDFQTLYARLDSAYDQHDMDGLRSLALPDAQIHMGTTTIPLSQALTEIMIEMDKGSRYVSKSLVTSVRISGAAATVSVTNESTLSSKTGSRVLVSTNRDTWVRAGSGWRLKESNLISVRPLTPATDPETASAVVAELKQRAVPLTTAHPGEKLAELAAFGQAVGDARIVALGEATHGTREFVEMKHRMVEYLVREKGFTVVAMDANWPESQAVDRYIKTGEGEAKAALGGIYGWQWYTEEMLALVEWMRNHNQDPDKHGTLTFTSFDMQIGHAAAKKVLDYLGRYLPDAVDAAAAAYAEAQGLELRRAEIYDDKAEAIADRAAAVMQVLDSHRDALIAQSTAEAWRDARQAAATVYQSSVLHIPGKGPAYREEMMAANVEQVAAAHPVEKIVIWSDNSHVRADGGKDHPKSMGDWLREPFGKQMYVVGFAFRRGTFRAIGVEGGKFKELANYTAPPSPSGSGDAILGTAGLPMFFLDLRKGDGAAAGSALDRWLGEAHLFHNPGAEWVTDEPDSNMDTAAPAKLYDGLVFVDESHPTHPLEPRQ
ncbi:MAG TPA: erythromycin esterase family protein [Bryobacteraceae bacterium]|jgi:erythromycin esterase